MRLPRPPVLTYSKEDYGRIAKAIDKSPAEVVPYENEFEAAATWYRLNIPPAERERPSTSEQRRGPTKKPKHFPRCARKSNKSTPLQGSCSRISASIVMARH